MYTTTNFKDKCHVIVWIKAQFKTLRIPAISAPTHMLCVLN